MTQTWNFHSFVIKLFNHLHLLLGETVGLKFQSNVRISRTNSFFLFLFFDDIRAYLYFISLFLILVQLQQSNSFSFERIWKFIKIISNSSLRNFPQLLIVKKVKKTCGNDPLQVNTLLIHLFIFFRTSTKPVYIHNNFTRPR